MCGCCFWLNKYLCHVVFVSKDWNFTFFTRPLLRSTRTFLFPHFISMVFLPCVLFFFGTHYFSFWHSCVREIVSFFLDHRNFFTFHFFPFFSQWFDWHPLFVFEKHVRFSGVIIIIVILCKNERITDKHKQAHQTQKPKWKKKKNERSLVKKKTQRNRECPIKPKRNGTKHEPRLSSHSQTRMRSMWWMPLMYIGPFM